MGAFDLGAGTFFSLDWWFVAYEVGQLHLAQGGFEWFVEGRGAGSFAGDLGLVDVSE